MKTFEVVLRETVLLQDRIIRVQAEEESQIKELLQDKVFRSEWITSIKEVEPQQT